MSFFDIILILLRGAGYTLLVTLSCAATGLVVGLGIAIARELGPRWLSGILSTIVYVLRGVPMLVLLFLVVELASNWDGDLVGLLRLLTPAGIIFFLSGLIILIGVLTRFGRS